jgi:dynein heavy chain
LLLLLEALGRRTVEATVEVYNQCTASLLPTPTKSHYTVNLRDMSKVFQGCLMITPRSCQVCHK